MAKNEGNIKIDLGAAPDINTLFSSIIKDLSSEFSEFRDFDMPIVLSFKLRIDNGAAVIESISASPSQPEPAHQRTPYPKGPQRRTGARRPLQGNAYSRDREPLVEVLEQNGVASVVAELIGALKETIKITAEGNSIRIRASTRYGPFDKQLELSGNVNTGAAVARYNNGVLEITAPLGGERNGKAIIKLS